MSRVTFWAGLAAWYAGLRSRSLALSVLGGLVVSMIVLLLQVLLQPGNVANHGVLAHAVPYRTGALATRESAAAGGGCASRFS
jgi:hypothetical protein